MNEHFHSNIRQKWSEMATFWRKNPKFGQKRRGAPRNKHFFVTKILKAPHSGFFLKIDGNFSYFGEIWLFSIVFGVDIASIMILYDYKPP